VFGASVTIMRARIYRVVLTAGLAFFLLAATASAHAYPLTTSPAIGGVVKASPATVSIAYDQPVTVPALALYDAAGKLVSSATVTQPAPDRIAVAIPERLADGTYTVAWRVTSADTHVVHGVYTFSVGARGKAGQIGAELLARGNTPESISLGFGIVRFLNLLLLLGCCGGAVALLWTLRDADDEVRRKLLRALTVAGALLTFAAVLGFPFQAAEVSGTHLSGGFGRLALETVRHQRFGEAWLLRAWLAVIFALIAISLQAWEHCWRLARQLLLAAAGVCLLLTSTDSGHASVSGTLAFVADGVHITAAAVWIGGLVFLLAAIALSRPEHRWALAAVSVPRFSLMAMLTVPLLGTAGIVLAYVEVHAWRGFWDTTSGVLILMKIGLVLPLLALGAFNNRVTVPALRAGTATRSMQVRFMRAIGAELALLLAVIGVTAALVDEATAKSVLASQKKPAQASSFTASRSAGPFEATVTLHPALAGANTVEMKVTSTRHLTIGEVDLAAISPQGKPSNLNVVQLSGSRFRVINAPLRLPGKWELEMTVRQGLTEYLARIPVTIGAAHR
jgi:copper transport protein